jgi:methionyl-tRNA synthetase
MKNEKTYFVTTALYYANGPLHLGHMLEMIGADILEKGKKWDVQLMR